MINMCNLGLVLFVYLSILISQYFLIFNLQYFKMRSRQSQELARRVVKFYKNNGPTPAKTVQHFTAEGESRRTIYAIIQRYKEYGKVEYSNRRGKEPELLTDENIEKARNLIRGRHKVPFSDIGSKLGMSKTTAFKLCQRGDILHRKRTYAPTYVKDQASRCMKAADLILKKTRNRSRVIVMDDESYVYVDPDENPCNTGFKFVKGELDSVPDADRFKKKNNYSEKFMVWQAISEDGIATRPFITSGTMKGAQYREECLEKILIPWLKENYGTEKVLFWNDMSTAHYEKSVLRYLESEGIEFLKWNENAPKLPQARPIERYWALCKREYAKLPVRPTSVCEFAKVWMEISARIMESSGKKLFAGLRKKLRAVKKDGPLGPLKMNQK